MNGRRLLSKALAAVLAAILSLPPAAFAQSGSWKPVAPSAAPSAGKGSSGTWTPANRGVDRLKEKADKVTGGLGDWYEKSPIAKVIVDTIENLATEGAGVGEGYTIVKNAPDTIKAGLTLWLQRKKNNSAIAGDLDKADRYDAFLSALYGDSSALDELRQGKRKAARPHSEQLTIKSAVLAADELQEGESARLTVSVHTVAGGEVVLELQSGGSAIGPVRFVVATKPGETFSRSFDQFFPSAGNYRLLVLARDARSDDAARVYVVVTPKAKFDGHYSGAMVLDARQGDKRVPQKLKLDIAVNSGNVTGSAQFEDTKPEERPRVTSTIAGTVDEKGYVSATWSYVYQFTEAGGVYQYSIAAPLNGVIKDNTISGAFACESKKFLDEAAKRLVEEEDRQSRAPSKGLPNVVKKHSTYSLTVSLMAYAFKDAPGRFSVKRVK